MYDLRSLVTDAAGNTGTSVVSNRRIDNTAPAVTVTALPAAVRGTVAMAATLDDGNGAGVTSVRYQVRPASTGTWTDFCTAASAPFTCSAATGTFAGRRDRRARDRDRRRRTGDHVGDRRQPDRQHRARLGDADRPGHEPAGHGHAQRDRRRRRLGIASVQFQRAPAGTSTWTTICTDTSSSYSCAWNTTAETDAIYDLRVIATDVAGGTRTSTTVANRRVDNNGPTLSLTDPGSPLRGTVTVNATATDPAGVTSVTIQRAPAGTSTWTTICTDNTPAYSCAWATPAPTGSTTCARRPSTRSAGLRPPL